MDEILKKYGLKYEDLNATEKETLNTWLVALQQGQLTIDKIKDYLKTMRDGVEQELTKIGHENKQDIFLKARLRNYMLLEAFLETPERAQKMIEKSLSGIKK
jgi:hypothetical protein